MRALVIGGSGLIGSHLADELLAQGKKVRVCSYVSDTELTGCFNAGSGIGHSIKEVIGTIAKVIGMDVQPNHKPGRGFDVPRVVLDISAIRKATGWSPSISLEEGIAETWNWVQGQLQ